MIPRLIIGSMNVRGTLQNYTIAKTGAGGRPKTWADMAIVWMHVEAANGREELYGMQIQASMTHVIIMRYRTGVTTDMRILIKGDPYNIRSINDVNLRGRKLILGVERGVAT